MKTLILPILQAPASVVIDCVAAALSPRIHPPLRMADSGLPAMSIRGPRFP